MSLRRVFLAVLALLVCGAGQAAAHQTSLSYISVSKDGSALRVTLALAFRDLEVAVGLDADFNGEVSWGEAKARLEAVETYVSGRLVLASGGVCQTRLRTARPEYRNGEGYLSLDYEGTCPARDQALEVRDTMFFDVDPTHRVLLHATIEGKDSTQILAADQPSATLKANGGGVWFTLARFVGEGADHLLSGPDHLLFLLVLVLPALFPASGGVRAALIGVALAVTGFTLGHALTLSAATTGYLRPPQRIVEIAIAISVFVTAIDNVRPFIRSPRSTVAFSFGLIHGFGFASALGALDLTGPSLALGLIGFNVGIELAQVALVAAVFPVLFAVRVPARRYGVLPTGVSLAVAAISLWWIVRRIMA